MASGNSEKGDLKRVVIHQEIVLGNDVQSLLFEGPQCQIDIVNVEGNRAAARAMVEQRVGVVDVQFRLQKRQANLHEGLLTVRKFNADQVDFREWKIGELQDFASAIGVVD